MKQIYYNGNIHTMNGSIVQAMAVEDGIIKAVGNDEEILVLAAEGDTKTDLEGRCVVPGFNDSHCHVLLTGLQDERLNLTGAKSIQEIIERGRSYIEENHLAKGQWIIGGGYDQNIFDEPVLPDGQVLDEISKEHPIMIERVCGHIGAANPLALEMAGFADGPEIAGGVFDRDADGNLTGIIRESALDTFKRHIPKPDVEATKNAILRVAARANAAGLTSMQTDDLEGAPFETVLQAYHELENEGRLTVRIFEEVQAARPQILEKFLKHGLRTGDGTLYFKIGNIKLITDGSLGARTAYLREDYGDDAGNRGIAVYTQDELDEMVMLAHKAGMQVAAHAIGDGAIEQCIHAFEKAYASDGVDMRNRVVHCQFVDKEMLERMAKSHICADIQTPFVPSDIPLVDSRIGNRVMGYVWKTMAEYGIHAGGGSDSPVENFAPIWGIHCAVNRCDEAFLPEGGWHPEEKLSVEDAVKLYTQGSAYVSFEENIKGALAPGYLADFVVLSQNIFNVPSEKILETHVLKTYIGGKCVYTGE